MTRSASAMVEAVVELSLQALDVTDRWHWRWLLTEHGSGRPLADHSVSIDPSSSEAEAFNDLSWYLRWNADPERRQDSEASLVDRIGAWMGSHVLGASVGAAIVAIAPVSVRVQVPDFLLSAPLELAHVDAVPLARRGDVSLVFDIGGLADPPQADTRDRLRMVGVFSLPTETTALALRRERYELTRMVRRLGARAGRRVELEVLQYGVTRKVLAERMTADGGPDVLHLSGHGGTGLVYLETSDGQPDPVDTNDLLALLRAAKGRLRLAVLSACESAAATAAETLRWLELDEAAKQVQEVADTEHTKPLIGVAQQVARQLDCAVVAMRYRVADEFAIALASSLYEGLFELGLSVDAALRRALPVAATPLMPAISIATPVMVSANAIGMTLAPPPGTLALSEPRMVLFPKEPVRFVGRTAAMARASCALAPRSGQSGVLFHGMVGAGKTACALELAYRHRDRFAHHVWWRAPQREEEWPQALTGLAMAWEAQVPGFAMVDKIGTSQAMQRFLPWLRVLLRDNGLLVVLDNLETLLTADSRWRDPRWAGLMDALTGHGGESRVVLTSRVVPVGLAAGMWVEPVHALSRDESVLLARELPNLQKLLHTEPGPTRLSTANTGRAQVRRILNLVQGHPKLLELANAAAADSDTLDAHLAAAEAAAVNDQALSTFFVRGESALDGTGFLNALAVWTRTTTAALHAKSQELLQVLAGMEDDDRSSDVLNTNWPHLTHALPPLTAAGLIDTQQAGGAVRYSLHPGIAETIRAITPTHLRDAIDSQLAVFWGTIAAQATEWEGSEHTAAVVRAGLAAVPYLLRQRHWDLAAEMIEMALNRDESTAVAQVATAHLRRIADTTGTPSHTVALGMATVRVDPAKGEQLLHTALQRATVADDHHLAIRISTGMINIYRASGRLPEALALADRLAELTRLAGLGPWSQLANEGVRLQVLRRMGQAEHVLAEVQRLLDRITHLPDPQVGNEMVIAWQVRESILNLGTYAACNLKLWQEALDLNAAILASMRGRNAGDLAIAIVWGSDFYPLLHLGRLDQADHMLQACQQIYEDHHDIPGLANTLSARAVLADERGHRSDAIRLQNTALRLFYTRPDPHETGSSHHNLANHLARADTDHTGQLAHRIAAATIYVLAGQAADAANTIRALAADLRDLPDVNPPVTVADVAAIVEQADGVRFTELIGTLGGDAQQTLDKVLQTASRLRGVHMIAGLSDDHALRVLALFLDHNGDLPGPALHRELENRLRQVAADTTGDDAAPVSAAGLARATLGYLATTPEHVSTIAKAAAIPADNSRFDPATLGVGALVLVALQTEVEFTRSEDGRWRLHIHKQSMQDSTIATLISKLLSFYRPQVESKTANFDHNCDDRVTPK